MRILHQAQVKWISRVSETSTDAKSALAQSYETWQASEDGGTHWVSQIDAAYRRAKSAGSSCTRPLQSFVPRKVGSARSSAQAEWEKKCWHLGNRRFACETDAQTAMEREKKGQPAWLDIHHELVAHARHASRGRPRKEDSPLKEEWQIKAQVTINQKRVEQEAWRRACWIVGTNILETAELSDHALTTTYKEQGGVERGFVFSKTPCSWLPPSLSKSPNGSWR
jgi:transposase